MVAKFYRVSYFGQKSKTAVVSSRLRDGSYLFFDDVLIHGSVFLGGKLHAISDTERCGGCGDCCY